MSTTLAAPQQELLTFLLDNTDPDSYLVATLTATEAAPWILATSRPVLALGGFQGSDDVVDVDRLARMVADGELRFVLGDSGLARNKPEISRWLTDNCPPLTIPGATGSQSPDPQTHRFGGEGQIPVLYDCRYE